MTQSQSKMLWIKRIRALPTRAKQTIQDYVVKVEKMQPDQKKKIVRGVIAFALLNLAYSIFSIYTLLSFALIVAGVFVYLQINIKEIRKKGLITYLPAKHQKTLLQRSLFDVLCDMWFIPKVSTYAKAIATPFFIKIEPTEAIHQFKDLAPEARKAVLTKVDSLFKILINSERVLSIYCQAP